MEILPTLEKNYLSDRDVKASVIWLHGLGADGNDFAGRLHALQEAVRESDASRLGHGFR